MRPQTALALLLIAFCTPSSEAQAATAAGVRVEVLVGGRTLPEYAARGTQYVEASRGREYSIRLVNETGARVGVALAVDGLNVVDASHRPASDAPKWVLGPWEEVVVEGWQVDAGRARHFLFTSETRSYGAWLGDTRNLGNISAAVFREQAPACCTGPRREDRWSGAPSGSAESESRGPSSGGASLPPPRQEKRSSADADYAATGAGRSTRQDVQWVQVQFEAQPAALVELRYGFRDELVELGVLPAPRPQESTLSRRERSQGFAPEPAPYCCR